MAVKKRLTVRPRCIFYCTMKAHRGPSDSAIFSFFCVGLALAVTILLSGCMDMSTRNIGRETLDGTWYTTLDHNGCFDYITMDVGKYDEGLVCADGLHGQVKGTFRFDPIDNGIMIVTTSEEVLEFRIIVDGHIPNARMMVFSPTTPLGQLYTRDHP